MNWIRALLFPAITRRKACEIALAHLARPMPTGPLVCHSKLPEGFHLYLSTSEPSWYVTAPWGDSGDVPIIRSRRVIVIGKTSGTVHYDGSAGDEG